MPDDLASTLAGIRRREEAVHMPFSPYRCCELSQADVPPILAALEAVLKLADDWEQRASQIDGSAEKAAANNMPETVIRYGALAQAGRECADSLRAAITAELTGTGKEGSDE